MTRSHVPHTRQGVVAWGVFLLTAALSGCTGDESGTVSSTPKNPPEAVKVVPSAKGGPAPRVPRGPDQAKALQEAKAK